MKIVLFSTPKKRKERKKKKKRKQRERRSIDAGNCVSP